MSTKTIRQILILLFALLVTNQPVLAGTPVFNGTGDSGTRVVLTSDQTLSVGKATESYLQTVSLSKEALSHNSVEITESATDVTVRFRSPSQSADRVYSVEKTNLRKVQQIRTVSLAKPLVISGLHALALADFLHVSDRNGLTAQLGKYNVVEYSQDGFFIVGLSPKVGPDKKLVARARSFRIDIQTGNAAEVGVPL